MPDPGEQYRRPTRRNGFACVSINGRDGAVRLAVSGELDLATSAELSRALSTAQASAKLVTLDLRRLEFMDCTGLAVLVAAADRARACGDHFRLVRGSPPVDRLLALTGFEHRFEMPPI
jgi:anti-anti-sigma factor